MLKHVPEMKLNNALHFDCLMFGETAEDFVFNSKVAQPKAKAARSQAVEEEQEEAPSLLENWLAIKRIMIGGGV